jgi:integrase
VPRPKGDGVKVVRKKLADGSTREYRYVKPERAPSLSPVPSTMEGVAFLGSVDFRKRAPATQSQYRLTIELVRKDWGVHPISAIRPPHIQQLKDDWQDQPGKANTILAVLSVLFNFGIARGLCDTNPAARPGKFARRKRSDIWTREEEDRVVAAFRPRLRLAFYLLLYTLQRPSDVLDMHRDRLTERYDRMFIAVKQAKTGALVDVPVHSRLAPLLNERLAEPFGGPWLTASPRGHRWTRRNFSRAWDHDLRLANLRLARELFRQGLSKEQVREELKDRHRQRRDLRRTGIVRLAEAGATTPQIAAISGHAIDYCQRIIDTYLPRRTEVAVGGIEAWESEKVAGVAYLETHRRRNGNQSETGKLKLG